MISMLLNPFGFINPLTWPLGVVFIAVGIAALALAYLIPTFLRPFRQIIAFVGVAALAGGLAYGKGAADCAARHQYAELQEQVRVLHRKIEIETKVQAADAKRATELTAKLRDFQRKAASHVENVKNPARCGLDASGSRGVQSILKIR